MDPDLAGVLGIYGIGGGADYTSPPSTPFGGITGATGAPPRYSFPFNYGPPTTVAPSAADIGATDYAVNPQNRADVAFPPASANQSLGNVSPNAPQTAMASAGNLGGSTGSKLLDTLRGIKAPAPPQVQTVHTPPPPRPVAAIHGGELLNMMTSLGVTPQEFLRMTQLRLGR